MNKNEKIQFFEARDSVQGLGQMIMQKIRPLAQTQLEVMSESRITRGAAPTATELPSVFD